MKTFVTIIGFSIGSCGLVLVDLATASDAWRLFFYVSGGYIFGKIFP